MEKLNVFPDEERRAQYAESFYPGDPVDLTKTISQFYFEAEKKHIDGEIISIVSPHAGYVYSGHVAAAGFKLLEGMKYDVVVVISPSHADMFQGADELSRWHRKSDPEAGDDEYGYARQHQ